MAHIQPNLEPRPHCTTVEAARRLGMAVRTVQLMVDRGDLEAWKTPVGHRRISEESLQHWIARRQFPTPLEISDQARLPRVLVIDDSIHYQNLVSLVMAQRFPEVDLYIADGGLSGLAMYGRLRPDVLIVDFLLPGIDGATLITSLRSHEQFAGSELIVMTVLGKAERQPYAFALSGVPVVYKPQLVAKLPQLVERSLAVWQQARSSALHPPRRSPERCSSAAQALPVLADGPAARVTTPPTRRRTRIRRQ